ncbi:hypothetical protein BCV69DRAFT_221682 [Microstroma glucosiphilum]|uniref:Uncharacterized protein n=1 Tax=Pseudomicrostroma glucosiphilum TaxID=1684307 RepID=A0A316U4H3_9BASI|nr:hypothetical protein BCV69DRAFT_221682 [Pseudomicrostroma glucosiphilum]PWN20159.1 hypothetical protein BCV69DRAFT_221682 [Pseudomicrostroma glucosiphilum]
MQPLCRTSFLTKSRCWSGRRSQISWELQRAAEGLVANAQLFQRLQTVASLTTSSRFRPGAAVSSLCEHYRPSVARAWAKDIRIATRKLIAYMYLRARHSLRNPVVGSARQKWCPHWECLPMAQAPSCQAWYLDAIVPRSNRGIYSDDNIHLLHVGCKFVKQAFDLEEAMVLIAHLGEDCRFEVGANGMLCPAVLSRVDHETMSLAVVEAWAKRPARPKHRSHHVSAIEGPLTLEQIVRVVKRVMVTETTCRDPSGSELPLPLASLDRINPNGDYTEDNIRLLLLGLNKLRRVCVDERPIVDWLKRISPATISRGRRLREQEHVRLPYSSWGEKLLARVGVDEIEALPMEAMESQEEGLGDEDAEERETFEDVFAH